MTVELEAYFDFLAPDDIRIKGTRIGIETVLYEHIHHCLTPDEIAHAYPSLTPEQVYATILYYLHNKNKVTAYLNDWLEWGRHAREQQAKDPPQGLARLLQLKAEFDAQGGDRGASLSA